MWFDSWIRRRWERRMSAELRFHLDSLVEDYVREGLDREEAERRARREFGSVALAQEECRDQRFTGAVENVWRDIRYALRVLRKSPGFTAAAVLTLALGIGANTAIYQLLDAIRLRPLPVPDPHQLVVLDVADRTRLSRRQTTGYPILSNPLWERFRDEQRAFAGVLAWSNEDFRLDRDGDASTVRGLFVSGGFFEVAGVEPLMGRVFSAADDRRGCGSPGAVLSYGFWQRRFGGDPEVLGRTVALNSRPVEVIGVTPAGFHGLEVGRAYDVAVPICAQALLGGEEGWLDNGMLWWLTTMGRVQPGRTLETVNAQLEAMSPGLFQATLPSSYPPDEVNDYLSLNLTAAPGVSALRTRYGEPLVMLLATTGLVLLLACGTLANLILARASAQERELAVRLAVGASRGRILQQLMIENGVLAAAGAAAGVALAAALSRFLIGLLGPELSLELPLDVRLLTFVISVAAATCLTFGLMPAWRASRLAAADAMKSGGRGLSTSRRGFQWRQALVVSQVALSLVLLFGALLFTGTLRNLLNVDAGFRADGVVVARVDFLRLQIPAEERTAFTRDLLDRIRRTPGVESAAEVRHVPMGGTGTGVDVWREGADPAGKTSVRLNAVSDGYLRTMGIPLVAGRDLDARDSGSTPNVALVNPTFAALLGFDDTPLGERFRVEGPPSQAELVFEIVGLVPDTKYLGLREAFLPIAFVPKAQIPDPRPFTDFMIHSTAPPGDVSAAIRRVVTEVSPLVSADVRVFDATVQNGLLRERLMATLSGFFGALAVVLAAVGLYGVLSYLVVRRTNEIGIRMALGARRADILAMVLRRAGVLLATGLAVGSVLAIAAAGPTRSLLFGLEPYDVGTVGLACAVLAAVAAAASYLPARRAARMAPLAALRKD